MRYRICGKSGKGKDKMSTHTTQCKGYVGICRSTQGGGSEAPYTNNFFFDDFRLCMGLGCNCDVLELFQSVHNANTPHLRSFEGPWSI